MTEKESMLVQAGLKLKELRAKTGLSIHKVAKAMHLSSSYLSDIERGVVKEPSDVVLETIAEYYNVDKSELFSMYGKLAPAETSLLLDSPMFRKTIIQMSTDERLTKEERINIAKALSELYQNMMEERSK